MSWSSVLVIPLATSVPILSLLPVSFSSRQRWTPDGPGYVSHGASVAWIPFLGQMNGWALVVLGPLSVLLHVARLGTRAPTGPQVWTERSMGPTHVPRVHSASRVPGAEGAACHSEWAVGVDVVQTWKGPCSLSPLGHLPGGERGRQISPRRLLHPSCGWGMESMARDGALSLLAAMRRPSLGGPAAKLSPCSPGRLAQSLWLQGCLRWPGFHLSPVPVLRPPLPSVWG